MTPKWKGTIINTLRKLSYTYEPRNKAKELQKVGPATYYCKHCNIWVYEGKMDLEKHSQKLSKLSLSPPNGLVKGKLKMDHIEPIVPVTGFKRPPWDWHEYIERMFVQEEGYQGLCKPCHDVKSKQENEERQKTRKKTLTKKKK